MATERWIVKRSFDLKFGETVAGECPASPGVYLYRDAQGKVIYVGKAKNLRRRIAQYRNARRMKKLEKTRRVLKAAHSLEIRTVSGELEAELLEAQLIQELRPAFNVQGAFSFMYPLVGLHWDPAGRFSFVRTSSENLKLTLASDWNWHGAYRSRFWVREACDALGDLLSYLGHRERSKRDLRIPYGTLATVRGLDPALRPLLESFFRGEHVALLERLAMDLLEKPSARRDRAQVEERLKTLASFYRHEARKLRKAVTLARHTYPVAQSEREALMIRVRALARERS